MGSEHRASSGSQKFLQQTNKQIKCYNDSISRMPKHKAYIRALICLLLKPQLVYCFLSTRHCGVLWVCDGYTIRGHSRQQSEQDPKRSLSLPITSVWGHSSSPAASAPVVQKYDLIRCQHDANTVFSICLFVYFSFTQYRFDLWETFVFGHTF